MSDPMKTALEQACHMFMYPIAKFLVARGFRFQEFIEIAKVAFVQAASEADESVSGISESSGVARKDIARLRHVTPPPINDLAYMTSLSAEVLSRWHQDPEFLGDDGVPRPLTESGFEALVERTNATLDAHAVRTDLIRSGSVQADGADLRARLRYFMPPRDDVRWVLRYGLRLRDLASTLYRNQDSGLTSVFEAASSNFHVRSKSLPMLRNIARLQGLEMLRSFDDWVVTQSDFREDLKCRTGVGIYFFYDQ